MYIYYIMQPYAQSIKKKPRNPYNVPHNQSQLQMKRFMQRTLCIYDVYNCTFLKYITCIRCKFIDTYRFRHSTTPLRQQMRHEKEKYLNIHFQIRLEKCVS